MGAKALNPSPTRQSGVTDSFKNLPRTLKIGFLTFRVIVTDAKGHNGALKDSYGLTDFDKQRIYLRSDLAGENALNTVIHEFRHAMHYAQDLDDKSCEEDYASRGANGDMALWLDNPRFFNWIAQRLREIRKKRRT